MLETPVQFHRFFLGTTLGELGRYSPYRKNDSGNGAIASANTVI